MVNPTEQPEEAWQAEARARMVKRQVEQRGVRDPRILEALRHVRRHEFVPEEYQAAAYDDSPQPIGAGQTISQPYIVAVMTQALDLQPTDRVLEIGVGSGYQTAVLAELVAEVVGVERVPELAVEARRRLARLGYDNVIIHIADGTRGYSPRAPYDGILVAAAAPRIPEPLVAQLAEGGRLVIPVGKGMQQELVLVERTPEGVTRRNLSPVRFVPLIGQHGFRDDEEA